MIVLASGVQLNSAWAEDGQCKTTRLQTLENTSLKALRAVHSAVGKAFAATRDWLEGPDTVDRHVELRLESAWRGLAPGRHSALLRFKGRDDDALELRLIVTDGGVPREVARVPAGRMSHRSRLDRKPDEPTDWVTTDTFAARPGPEPESVGLQGEIKQDYAARWDQASGSLVNAWSFDSRFDLVDVAGGPVVARINGHEITDW